MNAIGVLLSTNTFLKVLTNFGAVLLAIFILLFMITIHELGHYTFGKLLHFKITEFAVGFGKPLWQTTNKSGEKVSLRLIPLGGYCAFVGEDENSDSPDAFNNQKPWKRLIVLFGGVLFNFVSAILFSIVLLAVFGNGTQKFAAVEGPNASIIQQNDIILEVNGEQPSYLNGGFMGLTSKIGADEDIHILVERNGEELPLMIQKHIFTEIDPVTGEEVETVRFGVGLSLVPMGVGEAVLQSVPFSFTTAWECLEIFGELITGKLGLEQVGGPVTTIGAIATASAASLLNLLLLIPLIAINLAVFNLLPIPALDGARMVFVVIEWIRGKPINRDLEAKIHGIGLIILFGLVILIDVLHLILY